MIINGLSEKTVVKENMYQLYDIYTHIDIYVCFLSKVYQNVCVYLYGIYR